MHSFLQFLPHDAMQVLPMPSCGVCAWVCLSVMFVHSVIKIFSPSGSHTILVFHTK